MSDHSGVAFNVCTRITHQEGTFGSFLDMVKNPLAVWETWVGSLGWEDLMENGMATHSSILAWIIQWREEPGGLQSMGWQRVGHH